MDSSALDAYVDAVHRSGALDLIVAAEKAIERESYSAALLNLGELRGMIWLMHYQIESLKKPPSSCT